jgi:transketolase
VSPLEALSREITLDERSIHLRELVIEALEGGGRGHVGSTLSLIEIFRVLYDDVLRVRPSEPDWPDRDRCILSKGHGCLALYALLADHGFFSRDELARQCRPEAMLGGHPERAHIPGVEASTGALGHGLSIGVGLALALRMRGRSSRVYVVMGDGELDEGSVWEAAMSAAKHRLGHLIALVDYNKLQSYGPIPDVLGLEPLADKWRAFGFHTLEVNGHDLDDLRQGLAAAAAVDDQPSVLICHTVKGKGFDMAEGEPYWHHKSKIGPTDVELMRDALARAGAH